MSRRARACVVLVGLLGCSAGHDRGRAGPLGPARARPGATPARAVLAPCDRASLDAAFADAADHAWVAPRRLWIGTGVGAGAVELSIQAEEEDLEPAPARVVVLGQPAPAEGLLEIVARAGSSRLHLWVEPGAVVPALARPAALVAAPPASPGQVPGSAGPDGAMLTGAWVAAGTLAAGPAVDGWIPVSSDDLHARGWVRDDRVARWRPTPTRAADGAAYAARPFELLDAAGGVIGVVRSSRVQAWVGRDGRVTALDDGGSWMTGWPRPFTPPTRSGGTYHFSEYDLEGEVRSDQVSPGVCLYAAPGGPWVGVAGASVVRTGQRVRGWDQVRVPWAGVTLLLYVPVSPLDRASTADD